MARRPTTPNPYGWDHQQARAQALRNLVPGTPCPFCGEAMYKDMRLDFDHHPPLALGGGSGGVRRLSHSHCNRRAGQAIAQARIRARKQQTATPQRPRNSQRW